MQQNFIKYLRYLLINNLINKIICIYIFFALYYYCCQISLNIYLQFLLLYLKLISKTHYLLLLSKVICYIFVIEIKFFFKLD